ncbi:MAG TPA: hypothetical protein VGO48_05545 [Conexibacter sp.]|nr:hypothetical protein [Conexibacter sp.]
MATQLGGAGVGTLERWATALWVMRDTPDGDLVTWAQRINEVKPHVSIEEATHALGHVRKIEQEARERFPELASQ